MNDFIHRMNGATKDSAGNQLQDSISGKQTEFMGMGIGIECIHIKTGLRILILSRAEH